MDNGTRIGGSLQSALTEALSKKTEKERIIAVLDCVRGYKNEYDINEQKHQFEGFVKCKNEYRHQIQKIKEFVSNHNI
jgi:hypothetical protein